MQSLVLLQHVGHLSVSLKYRGYIDWNIIDLLLWKHPKILAGIGVGYTYKVTLSTNCSQGNHAVL